MQLNEHKEISPFHYRKGYYFIKKRYSKGNITPLHMLNVRELAVAKTVGSYHIITRPQIEAVMGEGNLYKTVKKLCDMGILNSYEKTSETGQTEPLIFYCINKTRQTESLIKEDGFSFSQEKIFKETEEILRYLSLIQWHAFFLKDYKPYIVSNELSQTHSVIRCKGKKSQLFLTFRFYTTTENKDSIYQEIEEHIDKYKRKYPFSKLCVVIICDATAGEIKEVRKVSQLSKTQLFYTTDLHVEKGNVLDWLFCYEQNENDIVRKRITIQI